MATIPSIINGVTIEFAPTVNKDVDQAMIDALRYCIKTNVAPGYSLIRIYISSAYDSHKFPSRHMQKKAIDISRINGIKIVLGYPQGGAVKRLSKN